MSADDKAAAAWNDYVSQQQQEKIEELERQLNAANQRIKQLEDARTVAAANSLANMLAYEDAVAKIKRLEDWKESALAVEREWNPNAIATMLGGKLGESQREVIQREVPKLLERIKRLEDGDAALTYSIGLDLQKENEALKARIQRLVEAGDALKAAGYFGGWADAVNKWNKAKEDKP